MKTSAFMVGFVGLKGGVTKSTLCSLVATKLWHDYPDFKISVWDMDNQLSLYYQRIKDLFIMRHLPVTKKKYKDLKEMYHLAEQKSPIYPIRPFFNGTDAQFEEIVNNPENTIDYMRIKDMEQMDNSKKDLILVDFPGTIEYKKDMMNLLLRLNALIIPVQCDSNKDISSQKQYCDVIQNLLNTTKCNFENNVYIAWNRADKSLYQKKPGESREETVKRVKENIKSMQDGVKFPFPSLTTIIPESKKIKDDTLQTLLPLTNDNVAAGAVDVLVKEFLTKILK
jgi:cellulose biosynthesis protein BcsQ